MAFLLTRTSLEELKTDVKVTGACPYRTGGWNRSREPDLWAEQSRIRSMRPGESMVTSGKEFDCKFGIITVPPIWEGGSRKEALHLAACYDSALRMAHKRRCKSIAFPLLSGDCNGFPRDLAFSTAVQTIGEFLTKHELTVYLSVKDAWVQNLKKPEIPGLQDLPQEKTLSPQEQFLLAIGAKTAAPVESAPVEPPVKAPRGFPFLKPKSLSQMVENPGDSFSEALLKAIDERGLKDPQVYQKANLDRRLFSKIRGNAHYQPSKTTALALCVALELSVEETEELLKKAGLALSDCDAFDIILKFYIEQGNYDIYEINQALFAYDQPILGAG